MKKNRFIFVFAFAFVSAFCASNESASAQEPRPDSSAVPRNSLRPDTWALEFGINYNFTLTSFQGSVLSIKRQLNSHEAIQVGIGGSLSDQSGGGSTRYNLGDTLAYGNSQAGASNAGGIQLNLQYVYYPNPEADVNFYFGAGPTFGYSRSSGNTNYTPALPVPADSTVIINYPGSTNQNSTSWNAGVSAMAGVECFLWKYVSIHAQYGLNLTYGESNYTSGYAYEILRNGTLISSTSASHSSSHAWQVYASSVLFGLSVYFR
jgi:hypothetical protein